VVRAIAAEDSISAARFAWAVVATAFACMPLGVSMWAFLDAARRPQWAWALSSRRQVVWLVAIPIGVLTVVGGLIISLWYLLRVRPDVAAAERGDIH
jgi:hypothetical protein